MLISKRRLPLVLLLLLALLLQGSVHYVERPAVGLEVVEVVQQVDSQPVVAVLAEEHEPVVATPTAMPVSADPCATTLRQTISNRDDIATLVQIIDTSQFMPPSPDPAGITYLASEDSLLISDSEVNEMTIFTGDNLFTVARDGTLLTSSRTAAFSRLNNSNALSDEPTGLTFNQATSHLLMTDDNENMIFNVNAGNDEQFGTADDIFTPFYKTSTFDSHDPEGIAIDCRSKTIFVVDGPPGRLFKVSAGDNNLFDAPSPDGDDEILQFDITAFGVEDPEGVALNPVSNTLFVVGSSSETLVEMSLDGELLREIDITFLDPTSPAGLTFAPSSEDPLLLALFIVDRGIDNGRNPDENDGRVFEILIPAQDAIRPIPVDRHTFP